MIAWTIAGSDSGGGAGIQADLKTFAALSVHGCSVITALTAQNTLGVRAAEYVSLSMIRAQIGALAEDLPARAIKTGMLGSSAIIELVAEEVARLGVPLVCDPVMVATSGSRLIDENAHRALVEKLIPLTTLLTPNIPEAEVLCQMTIETNEQVVQAARHLQEMGARSVLVKGGHGRGPLSCDYFVGEAEAFWLSSPRSPATNTHGTGCTLSSAIAACLARDLPIADAVVIGKAFINRGLDPEHHIGSGHSPVRQTGWPNHSSQLPRLTPKPPIELPAPFAPIEGGMLGFYPLIDRAATLARLLPMGVRTAQLRIKDLEGEALRAEIALAIELARSSGCRLFINDHWRLALELGAYGVHLGQEDLADADMERLQGSGMRLGLSTHTYKELARALHFSPSYLALGPIFPTRSKVLSYEEQGIERLRTWTTLCDQPLVAIGGIDRTSAEDVFSAGADGIAVIGALKTGDSLEHEVAEWLKIEARAQARETSFRG